MNLTSALELECNENNTAPIYSPRRMPPEMAFRDAAHDSVERSSGCFATTHWSLVVAAGDSASPGACEALVKLCRTYWCPLYAFIRRKGHSPEDARDLTQAFFERFLQKRHVHEAVREKGRFRSFLLANLQRFLCDQFDRSTAAKRGAGAPMIPLDAIEVEAQLDPTLAVSQSAESIFDRAWAESLVHASVERLRAEYEAEGKSTQFSELKGYLSRTADRAGYTAKGQRLGLSADAVAMAVVRLRRRCRELVRAEVANTVATPTEIDDEMRYLVNLLAG
jgi:RNA polymerase sigma-70 factor (ECF subfamily)